MKKFVLITICCLCVLVLLMNGCNYRNDYKKRLFLLPIRQGKIATIKQRSGHVKEYIVVGDSGYFQEAEDCPKCAEEIRFKMKQDSIMREEKIKAMRQLVIENEERNTGGIVEFESDIADSIHN